jgi:2-polyprenyl-3-methyl-5-hydroxy-6-metoxy-1,4-benzoquinol methylase
MSEQLKSKFDFAREMPPASEARYAHRYSICTLVTRMAEYEEMVDSFLRAGFVPELCEYVFIDNSKGNKADAYAAYNAFLGGAHGKYIILCHQDVILLKDGIQQLDGRIKELDRIDPSWAVLGNAGSVNFDQVAMRITHPDKEHNSGDFPIKVQSLDENFILAKNSANLCVSHDLFGFHLYGTDICQMARFVGRTCWVVDFNLLHNSKGKIDSSFYKLCTQMEVKQRKFRAENIVRTTCTVLFFSDSWYDRGKVQFNRIYYAKKNCPDARDQIRKMLESLGLWSYALFWTLHKASRPFKNLARSTRKRIMKFQQSKLAKKNAVEISKVDSKGMVKPFTNQEFWDWEVAHGLTPDNSDFLNLHYNLGKWIVDNFHPQSFVEIGSGSGALLEFMCKAVSYAEGYDISVQSQKYFQERNPALASRYRLQRTNDIQLERLFDVCCSIEVFEHISDDDLHPLMRQIAMRCKYFVFSSTPFPHQYPDFDIQWGHINVKSSEQWDKFFNEFGFKKTTNKPDITQWACCYENLNLKAGWLDKIRRSISKQTVSIRHAFGK